MIWPLEEPTKSCRIHTPIKYEIKFNVNVVGKNDKNIAKNIIRTGCINLIRRLRMLLSNYKNPKYITVFNDEYIFKIEEHNSIGKMLERVYFILYPDVKYITAELIYHTKILTIHIKDNNIENRLKDVLNECIKFYSKIQEQVS